MKEVYGQTNVTYARFHCVLYIYASREEIHSAGVPNGPGRESISVRTRGTGCYYVDLLSLSPVRRKPCRNDSRRKERRHFPRGQALGNGPCI